MITQNYGRAYRSNAVLTASPGQLVLMLYDGALKALALARQGFAEPESNFQRIATINNQLQRAQAIFTELQSGLNHETGGELARTLDGLYDYYYRRLLEANLRKEEEPVIEVERLVKELRDAWAQMLTQNSEAPAEGLRVVA